MRPIGMPALLSARSVSMFRDFAAARRAAAWYGDFVVRTSRRPAEPAREFRRCVGIIIFGLAQMLSDSRRVALTASANAFTTPNNIYEP